MPSLPISTPQPIVIVNHDRPGTPHLTLEVVNDEEIVVKRTLLSIIEIFIQLPLFGPFFTIELQEIEVKKNDSSMREARIQLPVFGPQPLLAIEWKKVNDDEVNNILHRYHQQILNLGCLKLNDAGRRRSSGR